MAESTICDFCRENILRAKTTWGYHHPFHCTLKDSMEVHCEFCMLLYKDITQNLAPLMKNCGSDIKLQRWLDPFVYIYNGEIDTALYRWSIRALGRAREGKEMVAVTFRVVPRAGKEAGSERRAENVTFGLPERVFYCFPEEDLGDLLQAHNLGPSTNPGKSEAAQIKRWIQSCDNNHERCPARMRARQKAKKRDFVPTRLLEIGEKKSKKNIRVVETGPNKITASYATLSHCWGPANPYDPQRPKKDLLTQKTMKEFMTTGIQWEKSPETLSKRLRLRGPGGDFTSEGGLMHKVYRNSHCNIAAADSKDPAGGLFREREPFEVLPARFEADGMSLTFGKKDWRVIRGDLWDNVLLKTSLYGRGWVFQERMLSPRALHFGQHQIYWDCAEVSACETLPSGLPLPLDQTASSDRHWRGRLLESGTSKWVAVSGANDQSIENFWKIAVRAYSGCDLTNQTDKCTAIWGIAKLLRDNLGEEYGAGLWEQALAEQLAWRVADCATAERPWQIQSNPSWAWTSVKGIVLLADRVHQDRVYSVGDHDGKPLAFVVKKRVRPVLSRETSNDIKEDIRLMDKKLDEVARTRKESAFTDVTPGEDKDDSHSSHDKERDKEPEMEHNRIKIQGHINIGVLKWRESAAKWTLALTEGTEFAAEDAKVDAFPDIKPKTSNDVTRFIVLSLSYYARADDSAPSLLGHKERPHKDSRFSGVGIMMRPLAEKPNVYVRTGALHIQHLSAGMWEHLQDVGWEGKRAKQKWTRAAGVKFELE